MEMCTEAGVPDVYILAFVRRSSTAAPLYTQEERPLLDDDSAQRDTLYERSERVAAALASTGDELRDLIADVNQGAALHAHAGDGTHAKSSWHAPACMHACMHSAVGQAGGVPWS